MTEKPSGTSEKPDKDRRLAEALRANLRRRKAQAKARRGENGPSDSDAGKPDPGGKDRKS